MHVGDTVSISIYTPEYEIIQFVGYREGEGVIGPDADQAHMILYPSCSKNDTGQTDEYEIVGVYACPPPEIGSLRFDPDTVLIPKGSVENADRYRTDDMSHYPLLNAYLLPNGAQDAFEEWLTEQGLKNCFLYYDYGYSAACEAIWEMRSNGTRLLIVGIAASALSIALFALLLRLLTAPTVRCMRLIGQSPKAIRKSFYRTIPLWTVPSMLSGGLFGWLLFGLISRTFLSASVAYGVKIAGLAALTQAAADSIALMLTGASTSRVPLMRGGKR